jgi:uncharacterized RDD family membrane protein YckC
MNEKIYILVINGKPHGPFTIDELQKNQIKPDSFVRKPGMDDYKEAHEFDELRQILGFKKRYAAPQYFAGFDLRMLAVCIDWFIIIGVTSILELIFALLFDDKMTTIIILGSGLLVMPILKFIYQVVLENKQQATIGKKLMNIRVTNMNGLKPKFSEILIRNLAKILSTATFFFGYFYLFLNKKQQTLHDLMADTMVIKDRLV